MPDFDMTIQKQIEQHAADLKSRHTARNSMFDDMEAMLLMEWPDQAQVKRVMENAKITMSPDTRNALLGAIRLMIATDPSFSVPQNRNEDNVDAAASKIEKAAGRLWTAASRVRQDPVHYDVVLSMLTFSEVHISVTRTADMVEYAKGGAPAYRNRMDQIAQQTPYVFDVWDPRTGYPELDQFGMSAYYREVETTGIKLRNEFGKLVDGLVDSGKEYAQYTLCHYWDYENRFVWLKGGKHPVVQEAHGLPFIPVVVKLGEGSMLFDKPEYQRQPFLYTAWKSEIPNRQNLALTVINTILFALATNPLIVEELNQMGQGPEYDMSKPGGRVRVPAGAAWRIADLRNVINPSLLEIGQMLEQKVSESTIYAQTLGEPLGANAPFSMVALLHQAGRLPLLVPQRKASWAISDVVKLALDWWKDEQGQGYDYTHIFDDLTPDELPDRYELECKLDIALPQDKLQQANVANILTQGDNPLVSQRYVLEKVLGVEQPDQMRKEIFTERAIFMRFMSYLQDQMAANQQQQGPPQGMPPGVTPPDMGPGMLQGLPPEMAAGGQQPPMNPENVAIPGKPGPNGLGGM